MADRVINRLIIIFACLPYFLFRFLSELNTFASFVENVISIAHPVKKNLNPSG